MYLDLANIDTYQNLNPSKDKISSNNVFEQ